MPELLFTNTFFEEELILPSNAYYCFSDLSPIHFHLHYLSCLTAQKNEVALVLDKPDNLYLESLYKLGITPPPLAVLSDMRKKAEFTKLNSWGNSTLLTSWAKEKGLTYEMPDISLTKQVHSKEFSFQSGPPLPNGELIFSEKELSSWWKKIKGPKVLKTPHGSSGKGHFISKREQEDFPMALAFFTKSEKPLLAEPWVERDLDFSSQWKIEKDESITYLGSTICKNSPRGVYRGTVIGPDIILFQKRLDLFEEHLFYSKKALKKMASLGFFGHVGIDAMLYKSEKNTITVQPIVEINARKTMGWAALTIYNKIQKEELLQFTYTLKPDTEAPSFLPCQVAGKEKKKTFQAKLLIEKLQRPNLVCL